VNEIRLSVSPSTSNQQRDTTIFPVVIVGGGFSGAVLAAQILRRDSTIGAAIVDNTPLPARGVAYSTKHGCHLLNVPAGNMSALSEDPSHFLQWARAHHDDETQSQSFLPRAVYGQYLESLLKESVAPNGDRQLSWIQDEAVSLGRDGKLITLRLKSGRELLARTIVLATGNLPPRNPQIPGLTNAASKYIPDAWARAAIEGLSDDASVLFIGSGLTSVDMAVALDAKGFRGQIHIVSRHGLMPQRHREAGRWPEFWCAESPRTTRGLLRLIRDQVHGAASVGMDWRAVIDALRPATQSIWQSLPTAERRRFLRHVRAYWEVHRHRIAPEIDNVISRLRDEGRLYIHAGRITKYTERTDAAEVSFRCRRSSGLRRLYVDRVINCTGSESDCRRSDDPLLISLFATGMGRPGPLALGLDVDSKGALFDRYGTPSASLYAIGPMRKGFMWETTAVPEIRNQASELADRLVRELTRRKQQQPSERVVGASA
jgi:uncharacterized NAD(P)/FAD-binding protein YdhS